MRQHKIVLQFVPSFGFSEPDSLDSYGFQMATFASPRLAMVVLTFGWLHAFWFCISFRFPCWFAVTVLDAVTVLFLRCCNALAFLSGYLTFVVRGFGLRVPRLAVSSKFGL